MFVEGQFSNATVSSIARTLFSADGFVITTQFDIGGETYVVHHVEVADDPVVTTRPAPFQQTTVFIPGGAGAIINPALWVQVEIPLDATIISLPELDNDGPGSVTRMTLLLDLRASPRPDGTAARLHFQYRAVDLGDALGGSADSGQIASNIQSLMQSQLLTQTFELGLGSLSTLAQSPFTVTNAGVGMDAAGTTVVLRVELNGPPLNVEAQWTAFYNRGEVSKLNGAAWCVFVQKDLLMSPMRVASLGAVQDFSEDYGFELSSGPDLSWLAGWPGVKISIWGELVDFCVIPPFPAPVDVDVQVTTEVRFSVPETNTLRINIRFDGGPTDMAEVVGCLSAMMAFWPLFGTMFLDWGVAGPNYYVAGLAGGPLAVNIMAIIALGNAGSGVTMSGFQEVEDTDADAEYFMDVDLNPLPSPFDTLFTLNAVAGDSDGLIVSGAAAFPTFVRSARLGVSPEAPKFIWQYQNACSREPDLVAQVAVSLQNLALQEPGPHSPLKLGAVRVLDDPYKQFSPFVVNQFPLVGVTIPPSGLKPEYMAQQSLYPCKLLLLTSGGARLVTIPGLNALTNEEAFSLKLKLNLLRAIKCKRFAHALWGKVFNPLWHVDPPWEMQQVEHLWTIGVVNAQPGAVLDIRDQVGQTLRDLHIGQDGSARSSFVVHSTSTKPELSISLRAPEQFRSMSGTRVRHTIGAEPTGGGKARLSVSQVLLIRESVLTMSSPLRHLSAERIQGRACVLAVTCDGAQAIDIERTDVPRVLLSLPGNGLSGAALWARGIVTWGVSGATYHDLSADSRHQLTYDPIESATVRRAHLYLLCGTELRSFGPDLRAGKSVMLERSGRLERASRGVVVSGADSTVVVDLTSPECPRLITQGTQEFLRIRSTAKRYGYLERSTAPCDCHGKPQTTTGRHQDGGMTGKSESDWLDRALRIDNRFASPTVDGRGIILYRALPRYELAESEIEGGRTVEDEVK